MKVLCVIGAKPGTVGITGRPIVKGEDIFEGTIYTVVRKVDDSYGSWYVLSEISNLVYYDTRRFIPISDISETEMERNYNFKTEEV